MCGCTGGDVILYRPGARRAAPSHGVFIASRKASCGFLFQASLERAGARDTLTRAAAAAHMPLPTGIETPAKGPSVSYAQQVAEAKAQGQGAVASTSGRSTGATHD